MLPELIQLSRVAAIPPESVRPFRSFGRARTLAPQHTFTITIPAASCAVISRIPADGCSVPAGTIDFSTRVNRPYSGVELTWHVNGVLVSEEDDPNYQLWIDKTFFVAGPGTVELLMRVDTPSLLNLTICGYMMPREALGRLKAIERMSL